MTSAAQDTQSLNEIQAKRHQALLDIFGPKFIDTFQSPVMFIDDVVLASPVSVRFFKKDFAYLSKQLYLEYQYRSWKGFNEEVLAKYQEITTKKITAITVLMTNTINRLTKLIEQNGVNMDTSLFPNAKHTTVPIIAAHARSYLDILVMLDKVNLLAGIANLYGVIDSHQRAEAEYTCKRAVRAFRSVLQAEVIKMYREASRLMKEQQGQGTVDPEMKAVVDAQGAAIKQFEDSASQGEHSDLSMDLGGKDASQLIDAAAAESTAAAAATRRTRAKTVESTPAA